MVRTTILALALLGLGLPTAAFAQAPTDTEKRACRHDVTRHCRAVINQGDQRVGQCLVVNAARISRACQQVLRAHGQL
jgi:hypothetical protein